MSVCETIACERTDVRTADHRERLGPGNLDAPVAKEEPL